MMSGALWVYQVSRLESLGLGQRTLIYNVEDEEVWESGEYILEIEVPIINLQIEPYPSNIHYPYHNPLAISQSFQPYL